MTVKFKIVDGASQRRIDAIVAALEAKGVATRKVFPQQTRTALGRIFCVDGDISIDESKLNQLLEEFRDDIQYIEGEKERRPM
jgi:hypothetical protein